MSHATDEHIKNLRVAQAEWKKEWVRVKRLFNENRGVFKNKTDLLRSALDLLEAKLSAEKTKK